MPRTTAVCDTPPAQNFSLGPNGELQCDNWEYVLIPTDAELQAAIGPLAPFDPSDIDAATAGEHFALGFSLYATAWVIGKAVAMILETIRSV